MAGGLRSARERIVQTLWFEGIGLLLVAPGYAWVTGAERSDFAVIAGPALARAAVELTEFPMARQLFFASDNAAFARAGVVAHSISAGTLHDDYHQPGDEFEKLR